MSKHKFTLIVDIDDEAFAAHDGDQMSPPNDVGEWEGSDILRAYALDLLSDDEPFDVEWYDGVVPAVPS